MLKKYYRFHEKKKNFYKRFPLVHSIISLAGIVFWVFAFKSTVLDANNIPSASMQPTLKIGDFLFVNKMRYKVTVPFTDIILFRMDKPKRGDIVTFTPPAGSDLDGKTLVKRVVGVPGDTVQIKDDEIIVKGIKYPVDATADRTVIEDLDADNIEYVDLFLETILDPDTKLPMVEHYMMKNRFAINDNMRNPSRTWDIPDGKYLVMGDNRDNSADSRACDMVATAAERDRCVRVQECESLRNNNLLSGQRKQECSNYKYDETTTEWGLVELDNIHGKVFTSYFSVNWGTRGMSSGNPVQNLIGWVMGNYPNAYVRWDRVFKRIY